jgi:hypothetical protein
MYMKASEVGAHGPRESVAVRMSSALAVAAPEPISKSLYVNLLTYLRPVWL